MSPTRKTRTLHRPVLWFFGLLHVATVEAFAAAPLFGPGSGVEPPLVGPSNPYCASRGGGTAWIERLDFDSAARPSGKNEGYRLTSFREQLSLLAGDTVTIRAEPGHAGPPEHTYWAVWLDADVDGELEAGEQVLSLEGEGPVDGTFVVPEVASLSRLRVVMSTAPITSPCGDVHNGEVEDYWLVAPMDPYCAVEAAAQDIWVEAVEVDTYTSSTGSNNGYLRMSREEAYHLPQEVTYTLTPGSTEPDLAVDWLIVIDTDGDEELEDSEVVLELGGVVGAQSGSFAMSPVGPLTRMRVILSSAGAASACGTMADGEVEDFWVTTAPSPPTWPWEPTPQCGAIQLAWDEPLSKWGSPIVSYNIWRDGRFAANTPAPAAYNWGTSLIPGSSYVAEVSAIDSNGHESPRSEPMVFNLPACSTPLSQGAVSVLALLINPADAPAEPFGQDYIRERWFDGELSAADYFHEASFGVTVLTGDVFGWYTVDGAISDYCAKILDDGMGRECNPYQIVTDGLAVAGGDVDAGNYDFVVGVFNGIREAKTRHYITVGATTYYSSRYMLVHELGHGAGNLAHAGGWRCPGPFVASQIDDLRAEGCHMNAYWDDYDPMGRALRHFDALNKVRLGYLSPEHLAFAEAPAFLSQLPFSQEFELHPIELAGGDTYAVLVPLSHGNRAYYKVEYRVPIGFDAVDPDGDEGATFPAPPVSRSLMVRLQREEEYWIDGYYIPVTVDESTWFDDPYRRIRIEAVELGETAVARVTYYPDPEAEVGDPCDWNPHCESGHCTDGYCCDSACQGQCEACGEPGYEGQCIAVTGAPRGDRPECVPADSTCNGAERDVCVLPPPPPPPPSPSPPPPPVDSPDDGCGCQSASPLPMGAAALLLGLFGLRRRRRRSAQDR